MSRALMGAVILVVFLCGVAVCGDVEARGKGDKSHVWCSPDTSWCVGGFGRVDRGWLEQALSMKPTEFDGLKVYEQMFNEPGEWWAFCVGLWKVERVVFSKNTKFVVTDQSGRHVESVAILFRPDEWQSEVWDTRRRAVVVKQGAVWSACDKGVPGGHVKFPSGSIDLKDVVNFEVVGAVEQRGDGEAR